MPGGPDAAMHPQDGHAHPDLGGHTTYAREIVRPRVRSDFLIRPSPWASANAHGADFPTPAEETGRISISIMTSGTRWCAKYAPGAPQGQMDAQRYATTTF